METSSACFRLIVLLKNKSIWFLQTEQIKTNSQWKLRVLSKRYVKYINIGLVYMKLNNIHVNPLNAVYVCVL